MTKDACQLDRLQKLPIGTRRTALGTLLVIVLLVGLSLEVRCGAPLKPQRIENVEGLHKFFATLHHTEQMEATTRIIHYGDSHVAADWLTGKLRRNLQSDFGADWLRYEARGINGARATKPLGWDWQAIGESWIDDPPTLIVVAYGSNEVGDADLDLAMYQTQFTTLLQHCQEAAPDASLLVLAPPDRARLQAGRWRSLARLPALIETQRQAALTVGAAFWNQFAAMGGAGAIHQWTLQTPRLAQKDHVHLTLPGYERIADALYEQLLLEYDNYLLKKD